MCTNNGIIQRAYVYMQCAFFSLLLSICNYLLSNTNKIKYIRIETPDRTAVLCRCGGLRITFFPLCTPFVFFFLASFRFRFNRRGSSNTSTESALRNNISTEQFSFGVGRTWCADSVYKFFVRSEKAKKNVNKSRTTSDCLGLSFGVA